MLRALLAAGLVIAMSAGSAQSQTAAEMAAADQEVWAQLVTDVFDDRPIEDGAGVLALETPPRAEDAAIVPVTIRSALPDGSDLRIEKITLVIDQNPSPVAAEFTFGTAGAVGSISTRVRVNSYTNVHAVAELSDDKLSAVANYVKASGGCSAPALKSPEEAMANLGEMRLRWFENEPAQSDGTLEAQLMIRHPNYSGLQMDQLTRHYIPAFFVREVAVKQGDKLLFRMEGGISISENPSFRFTYAGSGSEPISVEAVDTKEQVFGDSWPGPAAGAS
jgi:sulfur-oxidizing protein SoxY